MWIFGQVWFACLVGFAAGVGLDWALQVRPLVKRVAELEARLEEATRSRPAEPARTGTSGGTRRTPADGGFGLDEGLAVGRYEPVTYAAPGPGALAEPDRPTGLLPAGGGGLLSGPFDDRAGADSEPRTEMTPMFGGATDPGVDDFPGVARLSEAWDEDDRTSVDLRPDERPDEQWRPEPPPADPTWTQRIDPLPPTDGDADQEYLAFLRSGTDQDLDDVDSGPDHDMHDMHDMADMPELHDAQDPHDARADQDPDVFAEHGALVLGDYEPDPDRIGDVNGVPDINGLNGHVNGMNGQFADAAEVTSVLPYALTDTADDYPGYREDDYQSSGYQPVEYQPVDYEQDDVVEPQESTPLPRRGGGHVGSPRFAPFETPFGAADGGDERYRSGDLTPIEEGGFQPFQKPGEPGAADAAMSGLDVRDVLDMSAGRWNGDGGPANATADWFDLGRDGAGAAGGNPPPQQGLAQRFKPVGHGNGLHRSGGEPPADPVDHYGGSVFGSETDESFDYADAPARSLFEPVIAPEAANDYEQANDYQQANDYEPARYAPAHGPVNGVGAQPEPVLADSSGDLFAGGFGGFTGGSGPAGPFGPGSALPLPDGSAPSGEFRVKARTSSMVFHTESSPFYDRLEPQVWFRDTDDAERAGFTSWERPRSW